MKFTYDEEIAAEAQQAWKVMREFSAIERAALAEKVEMKASAATATCICPAAQS